MALRHRIHDLIEYGTIPTPAGPNVGANPLPNHPPTDAITADEGPNPVFLITDEPRPRSIYAWMLTNIRYGHTGDPRQQGQQEDHFQEASNDSYGAETENTEDSEDSEDSENSEDKVV